jgi:uncharacterized protein (DUF885 family)
MSFTPASPPQIEIHADRQILSNSNNCSWILNDIPINEQSTPYPWFGNSAHANQYWEALIQAARGNKEEAQKIVASLQSSQPLVIETEWKKEFPQSIDDFFDKLFLSAMSRQPQELSFLGLFESLGVKEHNACLNDVSIEMCKKIFEEKKTDFQQLQKYPLDSLTAEQKLSYNIFYWKLAHEVEGEKFLFHDYRITQTFVGVLSELLATFTQFHKLEDVEDLDNYLLRLARIPTQLQQTVEVMEFQKQRNIYPPKFAIEKVLKLLSTFFESEIEDHPFYSYLTDHLEKIYVPQKEGKLRLAHLLIESLVNPSFRALHTYCQTLLQEVRTDHGVWALPDGEAYYEYLLKQHTTTSLTADEIHDLGLQEIMRIQLEMRNLLAREGIIDDAKEVGELMKVLIDDPKFYYPNNEEGRLSCLSDFKIILERSREKLWPLFGLTPKFPVSILPVPKYEEEGMPAAYYFLPSFDGSREGIFYINLHDMQNVCQFRMETLAVHESEPGHHFQLSIQIQGGLPILRKVNNYTSYAEGWALYAEKLAYENDFYSTSFHRLGHLQDELLRAVRLVVDTGIHKKRWSREKAIEYMEQILGSNETSEVERYFAAPGQACAYKVGQLKILELRQKSREALGDRFDIKEFHDAILRVGSVPLTILEDVIDQFIQDKCVPDV